MCGIVGYISAKNNQDALNLGIEALKRLEYRGYDSAGLAFWDNAQGKIIWKKAIGRISKLESKISRLHAPLANPLILHTRWATHGKVTEKNAHPHTDCDGNIWVAHNGIIENYRSLRQELEAEGHRFTSETDTEVIAHLIEKYFRGNLEKAVREILEKRLLQGTYGLVIIARDDPRKIVAARLSSPLLFGKSKGGHLIASDPAAVRLHTKKVIYLDDDEMAIIRGNKYTIIKIKKEEEIEIPEYQKSSYPHYMIKEIMEQPQAIESALRGRLIYEEGNVKLGGLETVEKRLRQLEYITIVACGTARHAGLIGEYAFEEYAGIRTRAEVASEFRYRNPVIGKNTAVLAISQSGETADTLAAVRAAKAGGILTLGITNVVGSSQARETDAGIYTRAGWEVAVASTKAFTAQLTVIMLLTIFLGRQRQLSVTAGQEIIKELYRLPELVKKTLETDRQIQKLAKRYLDFKNYLYFGRKYSYPIAREGAHKIKETAYIHAEGCWGGEPKHCELSLISGDFPSVCIVPQDSVYDKMISNIAEIKARGGPVLAIANEGDNLIQHYADDVIYIPRTIEPLTPILSIIPLQLFAYHTGVLLGNKIDRNYDIDKPRNLAKSVTVE